MKKMVVFIVGIILISCLSTLASDVGIKVRDIDAQVTSIQLPTLPGSPETGTITVSINLNENTNCLTGHHQCADETGYLYWPVVIDFPLLDAYGLDPIPMTLVGPYFSPISMNSSIIAFDFGYIDHPDLGVAFFSNNNKNNKSVTISQFCAGLSLPVVEGTFFDIDSAFFHSVEKPWLRDAMDSALTLLQNLDPTVPNIPPAVLDTMFSMYCDDPTTEIIVYFPDSVSFETAELTGTDKLRVVPFTPALTQWGLIILVALIVFSTWVVLRRRKAVVG